MPLRSRLLLTSAALSLALGAGGFAAAQNRSHDTMQNGATQSSAQKQNPVPNNSQAQAPNGNQAGAANNNETQTSQGRGSNTSQAQGSGNNAPMSSGGRMENDARSNQNGGNMDAQAPASGNAAQNKQPAETNQKAERGTERNENAAQRGGERNENAAERGTERNENAAERGSERNQNAAQRGGGSDEKNANPAPNRTGNAEQREGSSRASTRLSSTEKTKLEGAIGKINIRPATNVNFSVAVGVSVPRTVVLHPLPADVVAIVPQYRGYDFFVVRDEVVIVEPSAHKIVDVIERTGGARTAETTKIEKTRKLHLSARDRTYIRKHYTTRRTVIDRAGPPRETHIVVGEDVPETVTIERFPREVYHRVPSVRSYGYVHEGRGLYLVEPGTRHVIESLGPDED